MRRSALLLVAALLLCLPSAAQALTPTAPANGAVVNTTHPLFGWTLAGDFANTLTVSKQARTTPDGQFFSEDYAGGGVPAEGATSWQPTSAIAAGTYWWNIGWYATDYSSSGYTTPQSFRIPAAVKSVKASAVRYKFIRQIDFTVTFTTNTDAAKVTCLVKRGTKTLWKTSKAAQYVQPDRANSFYCNFKPGKKAKAGERLTLIATAAGGGASRSTTLKVRSV